MLRNRIIVVMVIVAAMILAFGSTSSAEGKSVKLVIGPSGSLVVSEGESLDVPSVDLKVTPAEEGQKAIVRIGTGGDLREISGDDTIKARKGFNGWRLIVEKGAVQIWTEDKDYDVYLWQTTEAPSTLPVTGAGPPPPVSRPTPVGPTPAPTVVQPTVVPTEAPTIAPTATPAPPPAITAEQVVAQLKADPAFLATIKGEKGEMGQPGKDGKDADWSVIAQSLKADAEFRASVKGEQGTAGKAGKPAPTWPIGLAGLVVLAGIAAGIVTYRQVGAKAQMANVAAEAAIAKAETSGSVASGAKATAERAENAAAIAREQAHRATSILFDEDGTVKVAYNSGLAKVAQDVDALREQVVALETRLAAEGSERVRVRAELYDALHSALGPLRERIAALEPKPAVVKNSAWLCPNCNKFVGKVEAGEIRFCKACGAKYTAPAEQPAAAAPEPPAAEVVAEEAPEAETQSQA